MFVQNLDDENGITLDHVTVRNGQIDVGEVSIANYTLIRPALPTITVSSQYTTTF